MAKFSKGDKVESVKTGAKGVVDEVYGDEKYAVLFDGATNPDKVEGFQIKAANAKACNGKFKVGDPVRLVKGPAPSVGDFGKVVNVYTLTEDMAKSMGFGDYVGQDIVTFFGKGGKHIVPEAWVVAANAAPLASTNAVVQNAINARRARNATKLITLEPSKDGNKLNDFIHYAYFTADGKWKEGKIPYVRKDLLIRGLESELDRAKTTMQAIADALSQAKEI